MVTFRCAPRCTLNRANFALTCTMRGWETKINAYAACLADCPSVRVPDNSVYYNALAELYDSKRGFTTVHYRCLPGYTIREIRPPHEHFRTVKCDRENLKWDDTFPLACLNISVVKDEWRTVVSNHCVSSACRKDMRGLASESPL